VAPHERIVVGRNALRELVRFAPERILRVFVADGVGGDKGELVALVEECRVEVEVRPFDELTRLAQTDSHQGFVALVVERVRPDLPTFLGELAEVPEAVVLVLDEINDPQNLGAILRAAECFGVAGVVLSRNRGAGITPVVTKASAGASEIVKVVPVSNVADAVRKLKDKGFWIVAADSVEGGDALGRFEFPKRVAIIMGSEGRGVQRLLRDLADFRVRIPMVGRVDSLNVAQATAVFLHAYRAAPRK
jgi:23S rRNA (guanosine2251-2'-O)-methyltransferase